jgi:hypothetical protein
MYKLRHFIHSVVFFLSLALGGVSGRASFATEADHSLQPPQIAAPSRGHVAGAYAAMTFDAADVRRGSFSLPGPFELPQQRGGPLCDPFPVYAPDNGLSEWGMGWASALSIRRWRPTTDIDYKTDALVGPWGQMVQGEDSAWYPAGLQSAVRVVETARGLTAYLSDGSRWFFGDQERIASAQGTYEWYLTQIVSVRGEVTQLSYDKNASGRRFLRTLSYGGWQSVGTYRVELSYETLDTPFIDYHFSGGMVLDRRVSMIKILAKHATSSQYGERWRYLLEYEPEPWGPAYYLSHIKRIFPSGKAEPAVRFTYHFAKNHIEQASFKPVPEMDVVLKSLGYDVTRSMRSTLVDINQDGRLDLEHHYQNTIALRTDKGFKFQELPARTADAHPSCRGNPSPNNRPRLLCRMSPDDDELRVVAIKRQPQESLLSVCSREGKLLYSSKLPKSSEFNERLRLVDLNNDQRPDLIQLGLDGYTVYPNISQEKGYQFGAAMHRPLNPRRAISGELFSGTIIS